MPNIYIALCTVNPMKEPAMDGSGYPLWPEKPQEEADGHDQPQRTSKIVLVAVLAVLLGIFFSINRHGVSRLGDCFVDGRSIADCVSLQGHSRN
jgi:hypothetical protein